MGVNNERCILYWFLLQTFVKLCKYQSGPGKNTRKRSLKARLPAWRRMSISVGFHVKKRGVPEACKSLHGLAAEARQAERRAP
jgi:hypothetical protein